MISEPNMTPFDEIGGAETVQKLVDIFYETMDTLPEAYGIRKMHHDLKLSNEKLNLFLTGWLGGPNVYVQKYGHPMLRARHLPFPIGISERDQWMLCMRHAIETVIQDPLLQLRLYGSLFKVADHMRNQPEEAEEASKNL